MSTHNICFCGEIRKILCGYLLLPVAMRIPVYIAYHASSSMLDISTGSKRVFFNFRTDRTMS